MKTEILISPTSNEFLKIIYLAIYKYLRQNFVLRINYNKFDINALNK